MNMRIMKIKANMQRGRHATLTWLFVLSWPTKIFDDGHRRGGRSAVVVSVFLFFFNPHFLAASFPLFRTWRRRRVGSLQLHKLPRRSERKFLPPIAKGKGNSLAPLKVGPFDNPLLPPKKKRREVLMAFPRNLLGGTRKPFCQASL